jgi:hypothetical protein
MINAGASQIFVLLWLATIVVGIYVTYLVIKALRLGIEALELYLKKNR